MCWLLSSEETWSTSDLRFVQVISVEKREPRKHFSASAWSFLGLCLRPQPQKCGLCFKKVFLGFLFSTLVIWEKLKSDVEKFLLQTWHGKKSKQNTISFRSCPRLIAHFCTKSFIFINWCFKESRLTYDNWCLKK